MNIVRSGLTMPDRDCYLKDDAKFIEIRGRYRAYVEAMLAKEDEAIKDLTRLFRATSVETWRATRPSIT